MGEVFSHVGFFRDDGIRLRAAGVRSRPRLPANGGGRKWISNFGNVQVTGDVGWRSSRVRGPKRGGSGVGGAGERRGGHRFRPGKPGVEVSGGPHEDNNTSFAFIYFTALCSRRCLASSAWRREGRKKNHDCVRCDLKTLKNRNDTHSLVHLQKSQH